MIERCKLGTRIEEARRGRGEDRIAIVNIDDGIVFVVVDGAGGVGRGAQAADAICRVLEERRSTLHMDWRRWLSDRDHELALLGGQAAAVVVEIRADGSLRGASVGDCEAWIVEEDGRCIHVLTEGQRRKPLLGDGCASTFGFSACLQAGKLVVASDGLWKYVPTAHIVDATLGPTGSLRTVDQATLALVDRARLPNGALADDVAVVVCERT
mgnify:CR=1 FL=1